MKQSIKRSLLSLMLLGAAANIQASAEEEQGGGGAAAVADQETPPVEQMKKLVLDKVKAAMKEILINWPATVDKAVEMVGDTDGSIRTAMNMMFESFPEDVELTANVLEILVDAPLNKLMHPEANIETTLFNLDDIITNVIANYTKSHLKLYQQTVFNNSTHSNDETLLDDKNSTLNNHISCINAFLKTITTAPTRDILLEKIVRKICEQKLTNNSTSSTYTIIPTDEKLAAIIEQSKTQHKITFLQGKTHSCCSDDRGDFIIIPENYVPTCILHEIGHIENETSRTLNDLKAKLFKIIEQIIGSELSINNKLKQLLITDLIMLSVSKKEERDADSFALQKATKKQLAEFTDFFLSYILDKIIPFDDYLELRRTLSFESINQPTDLPKILPQQLFNILGAKNALAYLRFFLAVHPSHDSRVVRIQERIAELEKLEKADEHLAQLKIEAKAMRAAEREYCRYLQFLAGTKKAPREQLRARL